MPALGQVSTVVGHDVNSIGNKATTVALVAGVAALSDGRRIVQVAVSAADVTLRVSCNDGTNTDVAAFNANAALTQGALYEFEHRVRADHVYTYSMVYATGTPLCDIFLVQEEDLRGEA